MAFFVKLPAAGDIGLGDAAERTSCMVGHPTNPNPTPPQAVEKKRKRGERVVMTVVGFSTACTPLRRRALIPVVL
jgi:hypothetical protein